MNDKGPNKHLPPSLRSALINRFKQEVLRPLGLVIVVGGSGSGRTTFARELCDQLSGFVHIQSNSARYLIDLENKNQKDDYKFSWGRNVAEIMRGMTRQLLDEGLGVILDAVSSTHGESQEVYAKICGDLKTKLCYIYVSTDVDIAKERERLKYEDPTWVSNFEDFRVNTTEKMLAGIEGQRGYWTKFDPSSFEDIVRSVSNNNTIDTLRAQISNAIPAIKERLELL